MPNAHPRLIVLVYLLTAGALWSQQSRQTQRQVVAPSDNSFQSAAQPGPLASVPRLIRFSGALQNLGGKPIAGPVDVTFSLYTDEAGGTALWLETQTVQADALGRYTVLLGAMTPTGVPMELFTESEAHWLGVQVSNLPEQPRVLLVSVPYALKAGDAETLGGKPASAYALTSQAETNARTCSGDVSSPPIGEHSSPLQSGCGALSNGSTSTSGGSKSLTTTKSSSPTPKALTTTQSYLPMFANNTGSLTNSVMFQSGARIGVNTSAPAASLDVNGAVFIVGTATAAAGQGGTMRFRDDTGTQRWLFGLPGSAGSQDFQMYNYTNGHAPLFIQNGAGSYSLYMASTGNVGVLTNSPAFPLDVNGNVLAVGAKAARAGFGGELKLRDDTGTVRWSLGIPSASGATDFFLSNPVAAQTPFTIKAAAPSNSLYLDASGNVGLGTAAPTYTLDVNSNAIAIGTTTPVPGGGGSLRLRDDTGTARWSVGIPGASGATDFFMANLVSGQQPFYIQSAAPNNALYVNASGNIGLGTASPAHRLDVAGDINASSNINAGGNLAVTGTLTGNGSGLTNVAASNLTCSGCVTNADLGSGVVTGAKIAAGTITGSNIAAGTITGSNVVGGSFATLGANSFVGDQGITGNLTVSANQTISGNLTLTGTVNGWQIVPYSSVSCTIFSHSSTCVSGNVLGGYTGLGKSSSNLLGKAVLATGANTITSGVVGGTLSGGGGTVDGTSYANTVDNNWGTVAGGTLNESGDGSGPTSGSCCETVGGGYHNTASGDESTVSGGRYNTASSYYATVVGGDGNTASGGLSTVGGGYGNHATAYGTFAAGCNAFATNAGSFVWNGMGYASDCSGGTITEISSSGTGQFVVNAPGGIWFGNFDDTWGSESAQIPSGTFLNTRTGASLSTSGTWTNNSDRNLKTAFRPVNDLGLLALIARMPITSWQYKVDPTSIRHIGPMAQDFYSAFQLGNDDRHISTVDESGVALAGIQALYRLDLKKDQEIRSLKQQTEKLRSENEVLARQVEELRKAQQEMAVAFAKLARAQGQMQIAAAKTP